VERACPEMRHVAGAMGSSLHCGRGEHNEKHGESAHLPGTAQFLATSLELVLVLTQTVFRFVVGK
jgi:hypothetical protein